MSNRWIKIYLLASLLTLLCFVFTENYWRGLGYRATVVDDKDLWSSERQRIDDNPQTLAILGASRIQLGFSAPAFESLYPDWKLVNLSVNGHYPVAALVDLADNSEFRGVALVSLDANGSFRMFQPMQQPWVDYFHRDFGPGLGLNARLAALWQERFATANPDLSLTRQAAAWLGETGKPHITYVTFDRQRFGHADYTQIDAESHLRFRTDELTKYFADYPMPSPAVWLADVEPIIRAIRIIQARGGRVVLLRMPTAFWELDERFLPRRDYWDELDKQEGVTAVHFRDVPGLSDYPLPDGSHLDARDSFEFSRDVLLHLEQLGVMNGQAGKKPR
jgi:hypothetical protein